MRPNCRHSFPQRRVERIRQSNRHSGHVEIVLFLFCVGKNWIALAVLHTGEGPLSFHSNIGIPSEQAKALVNELL